MRYLVLIMGNPSGQQVIWTTADGKLHDFFNSMIGALALGFFIGGYFGGSLAQPATGLQLRRVFAVCLAGIAVKMFLQK